MYTLLLHLASQTNVSATLHYIKDNQGMCNEIAETLPAVAKNHDSSTSDFEGIDCLERARIPSLILNLAG